MRTTRIDVYQVDLPLHEGLYKWSGGEVRVFDSTVVAITTDSGITGYGEVCPLGPSYLPAYAEGARVGIAKVATGLIGQDPTQLGAVNFQMDRALRGHPYIKSALDMACWDILGKDASQPITTLLGGRFGDDFPLYRAPSQARSLSLSGSRTRTQAGRQAGRSKQTYRRGSPCERGGEPAADEI